MEAPMNNLYIGLLRLENRAAFFVLAKASQVTPRETAEERFHTLARGWPAYPVTPIHSHLPPKCGCREVRVWLQRKRPSDCSKGRFVRGRLPTLPGYQYHRRGGA